jgi:hypothetical protein
MEGRSIRREPALKGADKERFTTIPTKEETVSETRTLALLVGSQARERIGTQRHRPTSALAVDGNRTT